MSKNNQPIFGWLFFSKLVRNPTNATVRVAQCHDCNKIFKTQRLQTVPHAACMQRLTAQNGMEELFEKGNLANGSVW